MLLSISSNNHITYFFYYAVNFVVSDLLCTVLAISYSLNKWILKVKVAVVI